MRLPIRAAPPGAALAGAALVALGAGVALLPATYGTERTVLREGRNRPVNASATEPRDLTSHNSPTLVRSPADPRRLAIVNRLDTPDFGCALHVSGDAGASWSETAIPLPAGEARKCFAPDAAFGADGTLYVSFVMLGGRGNVPATGWVAASADGGEMLSAPVRVLGPLAFQVRLAADPAVRGRVWLTWLQGAEVGVLRFTTTGNEIRAMRSDDGGRTWGRSVRVSAPGRARVIAPAPAAATGGRLGVLYLDLGEDRLDYEGGHGGAGGPPYPGRWSLVHARSTDSGATWSERVVERRLTPIERTIVFTAPFPSLALSRDGERAYAAFHDRRLGDADVWLWSSHDGGATWGSAQRVNDTPRHDGTTQQLPKLALAPDGRLDVLYLDRRADRADAMAEASLQTRLTGTDAFAPRMNLSDRPFDARVGLGSERALPDLGSRLGLVADDDGVLAVWTDTRTGTQTLTKQDLAFAAVAVRERDELSSGARRALTAGGVALVATGLALIGWRLLRRRGAGTKVAAASASEETT